MKTILLLSGGLDSVALLYHLNGCKCGLRCLGFNYGQRHVAELRLAKEHCGRLGVPFSIIELYRLDGLFARSTLTDGEGSKIIPNRNAVFVHIAASIAASTGFDTVAIGCNADDRKDFPDCRKEFLKTLNESLDKAETGVQLIAPFGGMTKRQIVQLANENGWPVKDSLSCYIGTNCGKCDACKQRREALK